MSHMAEGMSLCAGQASMQGAGSGQCTQRAASRMARSGLNSMTTSSKSSVRSVTGRRSKSKKGLFARSFRSIARYSLGTACIRPPNWRPQRLPSSYRKGRARHRLLCHLCTRQLSRIAGRGSKPWEGMEKILLSFAGIAEVIDARFRIRSLRSGLRAAPKRASRPPGHAGCARGVACSSAGRE